MSPLQRLQPHSVARKSGNPLYFSLLGGNLFGEGFAADCILRQLPGNQFVSLRDMPVPTLWAVGDVECPENVR